MYSTHSASFLNCGKSFHPPSSQSASVVGENCGTEGVTGVGGSYGACWIWRGCAAPLQRIGSRERAGSSGNSRIW